MRRVKERVESILDGLAEAVTVQDPEGDLIYANQAAAAQLGFASGAELVATGAAAVAARYEMFHEDGTPVAIAELPARRVLGGEQSDPLLVRFRRRDGGDERWAVVKSSALRDDDGQIVLAVNVFEDVTAQKRAELRERLLARAGEVLASSLDYQATLRQVAELAVPELADWCAFDVPDDEGELRLVAFAHRDPAHTALIRRMRERYPPSGETDVGIVSVWRSGEAQIVSEIRDADLELGAVDHEHYEMLRALEVHSMLIVPVRAGPELLGTLTLMGSKPRRSFDAADLETAEELGRRAGGAISNARLFAERSRVAQLLQQSLLPHVLPEVPGWQVASLYRSAGATDVGGDFYDVFERAGAWYAVVGDVVGKGAEAAALTALARHTLRTSLALTGDMLRALAELDDALRELNRLSLCTVALLRLREEAVDVICAGHPPPLLTREGATREVGHYGPLLGTAGTRRWIEATVPVRDGDALTLYTDGVIDAVGEHDRFGGERLAQALSVEAPTADGLVSRLDHELRAFERGAQADDTAVLVAVRSGDLQGAAALAGTSPEIANVAR